MQDEVKCAKRGPAWHRHATARICVMGHGASVLISAHPTSMPGVTIKYRAVGALQPLIKFHGHRSSVSHLRRRKVGTPLLSSSVLRDYSRSITGFQKSRESRNASRRCVVHFKMINLVFRRKLPILLSICC